MVENWVYIIIHWKTSPLGWSCCHIIFLCGCDYESVVTFFPLSLHSLITCSTFSSSPLSFTIQETYYYHHLLRSRNFSLCQCKVQTWTRITFRKLVGHACSFAAVILEFSYGVLFHMFFLILFVFLFFFLLHVQISTFEFSSWAGKTSPAEFGQALGLIFVSQFCL